MNWPEHDPLRAPPLAQRDLFIDFVMSFIDSNPAVELDDVSGAGDAHRDGDADAQADADWLIVDLSLAGRGFQLRHAHGDADWFSALCELPENFQAGSIDAQRGLLLWNRSLAAAGDAGFATDENDATVFIRTFALGEQGCAAELLKLMLEICALHARQSRVPEPWRQLS